MMDKFKWVCRYSETDEYDKHGRWARLLYYNDVLICWVSRYNHIDYGTTFEINDFFPSSHSDTPVYANIKRNTDFEAISYDAKQRFIDFLNRVNNG